MYSGNSKIERLTLIIAAAGVGKRMGLGYPKQFLEIDGKPLFMLSVEAAERTPEVEKIVIVTGKESLDSVKAVCAQYETKKVQKVVEGGAERQYPIGNALILCKDSEIIGVQDGVRPFLKERYMREALEILNTQSDVDGVVVGVPLKDTVKRVDSEGFVVETPKRAELIAVHTPQIFRGEILRKAYEKASQEGFLGTDDSSLVERIGGRIKVLIGDYDNVKITTKEDLNYLYMDMEEK